MVHAAGSRTLHRYVKVLHAYLLSFTKRTQPLENVEELQKAAEADFNSKWETGSVPGWEGIAASNAEEKANGGVGIWCAACKVLPVPRVTMSNALPTGEKMYSKQTVYDAHLTSKKHIKAVAKQASSESGAPANPNGPTAGSAPDAAASNSSARDKHRAAALLSFLSTALLVILVPALNDTKANVERRFSLTAREREQELLEQKKKPAPAPVKADGAEGEEEQEEERIYNPLKLPLGWDGKPIPYWLYKLHGLGVEYRCEICSDQVYMGRCVDSVILGPHLLMISQQKLRKALSRSATRLRHASFGFAEYQAFPRDHEDPRCARSYVPTCRSWTSRLPFSKSPTD
jgi:splicing factor 3A subunit 3